VKYLLDTCVISELIKPEPHSGVFDWLNSQNEEDIYLSVLTIGEIQKGITKLTDSPKKKILQKWMDSDLQQRFDDRIINISNEIALCWGKIQGEAEQKGRKMSVIDSLIAATGIVYDCVIVTRNVADIETSGCRLFNPWEGK